jgi:hypothetical protein
MLEYRTSGLHVTAEWELAIPTLKQPYIPYSIQVVYDREVYPTSGLSDLTDSGS